VTHWRPPASAPRCRPCCAPHTCTGCASCAGGTVGSTAHSIQQQQVVTALQGVPWVPWRVSWGAFFHRVDVQQTLHRLELTCVPHACTNGLQHMRETQRDPEPDSRGPYAQLTLQAAPQSPPRCVLGSTPAALPS
jgi:hypothetical protein